MIMKLALGILVGSSIGVVFSLFMLRFSAG